MTDNILSFHLHCVCCKVHEEKYSQNSNQMRYEYHVIISFAGAEYLEVELSWKSE